MPKESRMRRFRHSNVLNVHSDKSLYFGLLSAKAFFGLSEPTSPGRDAQFVTYDIATVRQRNPQPPS
jgi:hypothetical protein